MQNSVKENEKSNSAIVEMTIGNRMKLRNVQIVRSGGEVTSQNYLKWMSLFILTLQNTSQVLLMRYARTRPRKDMFLSTTAVFLTEIVKLITCFLIVIKEEGGVFSAISSISNLIIKHPMDTLKVCVPAIIYTLQNNLLYVAVSNLSAATFMVTFQLKILTTALFSVAMLKKSLNKYQWISLVLLFVGASVVQLQEQKSSPSKNPLRKQSPFLGFMCVFIAALMSGFSGVYFEKILKGAAEISVWMRNIQLAVLSIPISMVTMYGKDGAIIQEYGILYGYDEVVWAIIGLYALGGLTVAVVVKYADNILKGFATSVSILLSCVISMYFFDFVPTMLFAFGTALVIASVFLYSKPVPKPPPATEPAASSLRSVTVGDASTKSLLSGTIPPITVVKT